MDLLRGLQATNRFDLSLVTFADGPLQAEIEALGIPVHVNGGLAFEKPQVYDGRVTELADWVAARQFDVAFVNTVVAFPIADAVQRAGVPMVWAVHESYELPVLWRLLNLHPSIARRAEVVLHDAATVLFEADSTRAQYEPCLTPGSAVTLPYGIDLSPLAIARDSFDRHAARRQLDLPEEAPVVLCMGTIEPRKGQVQLARAFSMVAHRHPDARLAFVGARADPHTVSLRFAVDTWGPIDRIAMIPVTPDAWTWYGAADLLVCSSDVESLPRTVLEAMAWDLPVLATCVFGLPELIDHGVTGWLCAPRDTAALASALDRALATGAIGRRQIAVAARELIERRHAIEPYARACADLVLRCADEAPAVVDATG